MALIKLAQQMRKKLASLFYTGGVGNDQKNGVGRVLDERGDNALQNLDVAGGQVKAGFAVLRGKERDGGRKQGYGRVIGRYDRSCHTPSGARRR